MKFCVPYYSDFKYFNEVDEIILEYNEHNDNIVTFVTEHFKPEQRIVVDITKKIKEISDIVPILKKLQQQHENIVVKTSMVEFELLARKGLPFFFSEFCKTDDEVFAFIKIGVTDVYVVENLAFNLKEIGGYCKSKGVNVRVIPNMAQYPLHQKEVIPAAVRFFIRPEDMDVYSEYVDVCEFVAPADRLSVLFDIYKSKQWLGDLKDLILGLDEEFYNSGISPSFASFRLGCRHKCMQEKCTLCMDMKEVSKHFDNLNLEIIRERNKDWRINELKSNKEIMRNEEKSDTSNVNEVSEG